MTFKVLFITEIWASNGNAVSQTVLDFGSETEAEVAIGRYLGAYMYSSQTRRTAVRLW
jgi:hypothetical protein